MGTMVSQIISLTSVYSIGYSGADKKKHQSSASLAFVRGIRPVTDEFPAQMTSNAENVFIWWRHHEYFAFDPVYWLYLWKVHSLLPDDIISTHSQLD